MRTTLPLIISFIVGFFMPFTFVSNVVRWRCQKQGLKPFEAPRVAEN